jgi:hypothetical protein
LHAIALPVGYRPKLTEVILTNQTTLSDPADSNVEA